MEVAGHSGCSCRVIRWLLPLLLVGCGRLNFDDVDPVFGPCKLQPTPATGVEYFIDTTGSDLASGTSEKTAWATFEHAWGAMSPGDTLTILDGVYLQELRPTISGVPGAPILLRAQHDGGAVIQGEGLRKVCSIVGADTQHITDIDLEGIHCTNLHDTTAGGETPVSVVFADRIRIRRVTARGVLDGVFRVSVSSDVLLEDVAAYGGGNSSYTINQTSGAVLRRCYARMTGGPASYNNGVLVTASDGALIENCVVTGIEPQSNFVEGFVISSNALPANHNRFLANIAHGPLTLGFIPSWSSGGEATQMLGTEVRDLAIIGAVSGLFQRADAGLIAQRMTLAATGTLYNVSPNAGAVAPNTIGFEISSSVFTVGTKGISNSSSPLVTSATHHDNVFDGVASRYSNTTEGSNERDLQVGWDIATYGNGAYLMRPASLATAGAGGGPAGAEILYRTVDGALTTVPLWPWPLEHRILAEAGVSVTWESGGGLWRTGPPVACE